MTQRSKVSVGIFHDAESARRAINEARGAGFEGIHLVSDDPEVRSHLRAEIGRDRHLLSWSREAIVATFCVVGAAAGMLLGFGGSWLMASAEVLFGDPILPFTGAVLGGFVGVMVSRGFANKARDFEEPELGPDEILVVVEADSPERIAVAEAILTNGGAATVLPTS